ncbi:ABC transporter permease subunit [Roseobacter sp. HKCCD9010]|uniref:carbohydrate ABC transporter permease n=1 Tax=unclassified Roseobacter TaxID=196798 RepID=UPI00149143D4|nr:MULTISPECIES: carbohydrate ABC transporter permease [unclassified Roseobacter]MBF9050157.1 ABC transporter permease subunit [Rhodobacterales bacterium HKCCD4356]NNV12400.1 ABC transporter permease subunit [Roseobacter sp. HKCCD7357]NNV16136.1 ABC transporter permease subunit [Roseobacter sp. HKCCD8768]NNV25596.1 ABC transporter permease subunit [Roseobacter sp. HKCCD8192]NNV29852.1 ABC transporter permease subunit [Roseobacter sp. HKCCD9061]
MSRVWEFLTATRGNGRLDWTDWITYGYLALGVFLMFFPVIWLLLSSFKTEADLQRFPPTFLPYQQETLMVDGYEEPLPLFLMTDGEFEGRVLAQVRRVGLQAQMVDPANPEERLRVTIDQREPVEQVSLAWENYAGLFERFNFLQFFWNSTFITVTATLLMLLVNSMAAFALSKYEFRGRTVVLLLVIGTLMIPQTVVLVPLFLIVTELGMFNSLWGVIIPGAATPTGVFLLRQYMITIPDEILDAARMDKASEWKIFWRIIVPLSAPAIAVLAILAIMWRWNDFLWPLIVLTQTENFTLQLALNSFQGELQTDWSSLLAMTVLTLLPIAMVFMFLQKYIATGIASTGGK